jgi:sigma-B regulation protein RsbU (phosphoserine phosphatase)
MRILVADDERITRASLARQLQAWGHSVEVAEDGEKAWALYGAGEFDLVLTDWEMPVLSGVELITRIRSVPRSGYVYLMLLTSRSDKADLVRGIEAGADDFLSKPFDRDELRVRLLAGERVVRLERTLSAQNQELRAAGERMRNDLQAAARVQRAMLPRRNIQTPRVRAAWTYAPTDELAGDALGMHLIEDRYLVAYVLDVCGHGVPAALLAVTAMHALAPGGEGASLLRAPGERGGAGAVRRPSSIVTELNRRFCASDNDGRFLTLLLCTLDTHEGELRFARAGHPLPIVLRGGDILPVSDEGGMPIGLVDSEEYGEVSLRLEAGDKAVLLSDGFLEQLNADGESYGEERFRSLLTSHAGLPGEQLVTRAVDSLAQWAGGPRFADDMSLLVVEWLGR